VGSIFEDPIKVKKRATIELELGGAPASWQCWR